MPARTSQRLKKQLIETAKPGQTVWDAEIPGFGLRVAPGGTRSFIFQFRTRTNEQGKIVIGRFPTMTVEEARKIARDHRIAVDKGNNPSSVRKELREAPTLRDLATFYCDDYAKRRHLSPQTVNDARTLLEKYVLPVMGSRKVRNVRITDIRQLHGKASEGSGKYQANRLLAVLSKMFSLAIQNEWRSDNPCFGVEKYREEQRWTRFAPGQVARLLVACNEHEDQSAANAIRLLLFTGARLQEALRADWSQFDIEQGVWVKPSQHTKTKIRHYVYLATPVVTMLREMRNADPEGKYLFPGLDPSKPRSDLKRPWVAILARANLTGFRIHDLRRTYASFMLSSGSDLAAVGKALGHTQASTTARYAHLLDEVQRTGANRAVEHMCRLRDVA